MTTVRQIERNWSSHHYRRLLDDLLVARPEASLRLSIDQSRVAAAAMGIIRLDELSQSASPLYPQLVRALVAEQEPDGGWGDLMTTALCLRALLCGHGGGLAIQRGLAFLANLQKPLGIWPNVPIRRTPEDPYTSAFVLFQLADQPLFRESVRFSDALAWFESHDSSLAPDVRSLWHRARLRCPAPAWS